METPQHAIAPEEPTVSVQPPHVLVLPTEGVADHVASQLREEGFDPVEVDGGQDGWTVRITDEVLQALGAAPDVALVLPLLAACGTPVHLGPLGAGGEFRELQRAPA